LSYCWVSAEYGEKDELKNELAEISPGCALHERVNPLDRASHGNRGLELRSNCEVT